MKGIRALFAAGVVGLSTLVISFPLQAQDREVTFAGMAFSGDAATIPQRFKYSQRYSESLKSLNDTVFKRALAAVSQAKPRNLRVTAEPIAELKGRDQALVLSLVLNSETVSVESFGEVQKLFVLIRGQALFFDFKSMTVVRSYPLSFAYIDNFKHAPTEQETMDRVKLVYEGAGDKPGLFSRFGNTVANATVPNGTPRFLQVSKVNLGPDLVGGLPASLKSSPADYETWAADLVSEAISTRVGVPVIPYSKGYAIGNVMSMQVQDSEVFMLTLPKPDYEISVDFTGLKKVKYSQTGAGASFIYGTYATVKIEEPLSGTVYMNTALKNGEVKVVPASQTLVDDFPAYYDSLNGMFVKLSEAVSGKGNTWIKAAAAAPDIESQIAKTKELMNLCK